MLKLTVTGFYTAKDQVKASLANKFIGRGSAKSSTAQYAKDCASVANTGEYTDSDIVFVSVEGARNRRVELDFVELRLALEAGATIIADNPTARERPYNIGERRLARALVINKYIEVVHGQYSTWYKRIDF